MTRRNDTEARLTKLTHQPRWLPNPCAVAAEAADELAAYSSELLDVMLTGSDTLRDAAYRCLCYVRLPESVVARLSSVVTCSKDQDQVALSLRVLAWNDYTDAMAREWVERSLDLGGEARRAGISIIPYVDDDEGVLQSWMLAIFDQGDPSDRVCAIDTSGSWREDFARTLLERGCCSDQPALISQALAAIGDRDFDRDWTVATIREVLTRWPEQETVLLSAVCCIGHRELPEFAEFVERMLFHSSWRIALEAGEALGFVARERVQQVLRENPAGLHESARAALESWAHDIHKGRV